MDELINRACEVFKVNRLELVQGRRFRDVTFARQALMYAIWRLEPSLSYARIGERFRRDHTTVIYAIDAVQKRIRHDAQFAERVEQLLGKQPAPAAPAAPEVLPVNSLLERSDPKVARFLAECEV